MKADAERSGGYDRTAMGTYIHSVGASSTEIELHMYIAVTVWQQEGREDKPTKLCFGQLITPMTFIRRMLALYSTRSQYFAQFHRISIITCCIYQHTFYSEALTHSLCEG